MHHIDYLSGAKLSRTYDEQRYRTSFHGAGFEKRIIEREKEVFNEDEVPVIKEYLQNHPDKRNLGILLTFQTGLRVGELAALKSSDLVSV